MFLLTEFSSLGELISLKPTDRGHTETGIFVLPQPVKSCGRLVSVEAIGFFNVSQTATDYGFHVLIYRSWNESGMYQKVRRKNFFAACLDDSFKSFTTSHNERSCHVRLDNINFDVNEGDFIAVKVLDNCNNRTDSCPLQPVIMSRINQTTQSVVLFLETNSFIKKTDVFLNINASIEGNTLLKTKS